MSSILLKFFAYTAGIVDGLTLTCAGVEGLAEPLSWRFVHTHLDVKVRVQSSAFELRQ